MDFITFDNKKLADTWVEVFINLLNCILHTNFKTHHAQILTEVDMTRGAIIIL